MNRLPGGYKHEWYESMRHQAVCKLAWWTYFESRTILKPAWHYVRQLNATGRSLRTCILPLGPWLSHQTWQKIWIRGRWSRSALFRSNIIELDEWNLETVPCNLLTATLLIPPLSASYQWVLIACFQCLVLWSSRLAMKRLQWHGVNVLTVWKEAPGFGLCGNTWRKLISERSGVNLPVICQIWPWVHVRKSHAVGRQKEACSTASQSKKTHRRSFNFTMGLFNAIAQGFEPLTCCRIAGLSFGSFRTSATTLLTGAAKAMMVF